MAKAAKPRGRARKDLSVEVIVDAAARLSESEGFEAVSMRRLADELGVSAMAFYKYFETKNDLLDLIANRYLADLDLGEDVADWDERLERIFCSFYRVMLERPVLAHVVVSQPLTGPSAHRMAEVVLEILQGYGFDHAESVEIFGVLASYTVGLALARRGRADDDDTPARIERLKETPDHPFLAASAEHYVRWPKAEVFEDGLRFLLEGYARRREAS